MDVTFEDCQRFWRFVDFGDGDPASCWVFRSGRRTRDGYARFESSAGTWHLAHRVACFIQLGDLPTFGSGVECDHLCRNRACCNPGHLRLVSHRENVVASYAARRGARAAHEGSD
jgi:hypothetical protein